jgi:vacuolar-type H+-ATPase subunit E/Vma4
MKFARRQLENMKSQMEKYKRKIMLMDIEVEVRREKLAKQDEIIKELQAKVKHWN